MLLYLLGVQAGHALDMARVSAPSTNARSQTTSPSVVTRGVQQLAQNPNIVMMNAPSIQNNPELLRTLIRSNPRMRELVDRNPELGHILNDPSFLRQSLQAARNPELMREMTRNADRALSNIEATPEGFNMLRRMYEDVQEPLMNVSMFSGNDGNNVVSNAFAARARDTNGETGTGNGVPNTNPLPNPWVAAGGMETIILFVLVSFCLVLVGYNGNFAKLISVAYALMFTTLVQEQCGMVIGCCSSHSSLSLIVK